MNLLQKFAATASTFNKGEYPSTMRTMRFHAGISIPYRQAGSRFDVKLVRLAPAMAQAAEINTQAANYSWMEAKKTIVKGVPQYLLFTRNDAHLGHSRRADGSWYYDYDGQIESETTPFKSASGEYLFSKENAIAALKSFEHTQSQCAEVARDGDHTMKHFARYLPAQKI